MTSSFVSRLARIAVVLLAVVAVLAAAGWAVLQLPQFGAAMSGARLERARANPQYRDGRFVNVQPEAPASPWAMVEYMRRQYAERWGVPLAQIEDMEWWQPFTLRGVRIVCTPTRHYSGRGLSDRSTTLWSSWSVVGPRHRFFYSGDTGYGTHFGDIGTRLGPFDVAFVKIGAYGPGASWIDIHMTPEQAVQAFGDLRGKRLFPVHWSTFNLAHHDWDEPIRRTVAAARRSGAALVTPRLGEWVEADRAFESTA